MIHTMHSRSSFPVRPARRAILAIAIAAGLAAALAGCSDHAHEGEPTGSTCPPNNTLTYDNFAAPFMASYCTRCHASTLSGPDRNGAPLFHDFDTEVGILNVADHVDEMAAAGPDAVNTLMPPDGDQPTEEERRQLGQWLACATANQ